MESSLSKNTDLILEDDAAAYTCFHIYRQCRLHRQATSIVKVTVCSHTRTHLFYSLINHSMSHRQGENSCFISTAIEGIKWLTASSDQVVWTVGSGRASKCRFWHGL